MKFDRIGFILYTLEYEKCVAFYRDTLELPTMFKNEQLTCFQFGNAYLMVEIDNEFDGTQSDFGRIKTCLRMNVPDVKKLSEKLKSKGVKVNYQEYAWGTIAKFFDPDGNLCAFKDSEKFEQQIRGRTGL